MESDYLHRILIVDGDAGLAKTISELTEKESLEIVCAATGEKALKKIKESRQPFSVVIADQHLLETEGTTLFEYTRKRCPDTQRFLLTDVTDTASIMNAVNKWAIQRYIKKPMDGTKVLAAIQTGIRHFELTLENDRLLALAKKQNAKLYDLNCELMETKKTLAGDLFEIETEINSLENRIKELTAANPVSRKAVMAALHSVMDADSPEDNSKMKLLMAQTIRTLFDQFNDIANRSGFEMPTPKGVIK